MIEIIKALPKWELFAYIYFGLSIIANVVFTVIITIGGFFDLKYLFAELRKEPDEFRRESKK